VILAVPTVVVPPGHGDGAPPMTQEASASGGDRAETGGEAR
jgi:hypothetical protein